MSGWVRSALACLAFGAAAVFATDPYMAGELLEPVSLRAVAPSSSAGAAGKDNKDLGVDEQLEALRLQLEVLRLDLDDVRRRGAGLCDDIMKHTNVTNTRAVYCSARQISASIMTTYVLSSAAFWICLPLVILKRALWYLPLNMDGAMVGHLGVLLEAVVTANICFNADEVLPAIIPQGPRDWLLHNPVFAVMFLSLASATLRILWLCLAAPRWGGGRRLSLESLASVDSNHDNHLAVSNRYQDLTLAHSNVMMLFLVQMSLLLFYFVHLHESTSNYFSMDDKASFLQWFVGCCVIWYTGADEMGAGFDGVYWEMIVSEVRKGGAPARKRMLIWLRQSMSFLVNGVGLTFIRATFPIILATSGPWGFIADCMMVFFVTSLDDMKQNRDFVVDYDIKIFLGESEGDDAESTGTMSGESDVERAKGAGEGEALKFN